MSTDQVRSLEELRLILKQHNKAFDCLVEEAERRCNGDQSLHDRILTELVVDDLLRKRARQVQLPQLLPVVPKKPRTGRRPMRQAVNPINAVAVGTWFSSSEMRKAGPCTSKPGKGTTNGLELGLGFLKENPSKKRPRPMKEISQRMVNGEEDGKKKKKKRPRISIQEAEQLRERGSRLGLPEEVRVRMEELGGVHPVLVITKYLYKTDMSTHHVRLNLPVRQLEKGVRADSKFLTEEEWGRMLENTDEAVKARLVGPSCSDPTEVSLKCWWMNKAPILVMTTGWALFLAKYEKVVKEGDAVQVWASRCNGGSDDVVLALVVVEPGLSM